MARVAPSVSPEDVAASHGCDLVQSLPELRLAVLDVHPSLSFGEASSQFADDARVEFVEPDIGVKTAESRQSSVAFSESDRTWPDVRDQDALVRVGAASAQLVTRGAGVLVAILDTGIELDHPALAAQIDLPGVEFGPATAPGDDRAEAVDTNGDSLVDGALGHGTHVAGIVHAIAPEARLLPVRVLDSDGVGRAFNVARGIVAAVNRGATVVNLSLAVDGVSRSIDAAIDFATQRGITLVGAAGNAGLDLVDFPAVDTPVIAVAGTDGADRKAPFSNYGTAVDLAAPSIGILSTYVGRGYASWSGTSMAAPFASGVAALLRSVLLDQGLNSPALVEGSLSQGAQRLYSVDPVYSWALGAGRVSAAGSVQALLDQLRQPAPTEEIPVSR